MKRMDNEIEEIEINNASGIFDQQNRLANVK